MARSPKLLLGIAILYGVLSCVLIVHDVHHRFIALLTIQYLGLLPASFCYLRSGPRNASRWEGPKPWLTILVCCMTIAVAMVTSIYIGEGITISDESAYRFQARIFASGRTYADALPGAETAPPVPQPIHFEHHIFNGSRWFGKYPPGWPALLAVAIRLRAAPVINPLIGGVLTALIFLIGRTFFDSTTAMLSVLILSLSPFFLANIVGTMSHASCAMFIVIGTYLGLLSLSQRKVYLFALGFASIGLACLIRPLTGCAVGLSLFASVLYYTCKRGLNATPIVVAAFVVTILTAAGYLSVQRYYTGSIFVTPYALSAGSHNTQEIDLRPLNLILNAVGLQRRELLATVLYTSPFWVLLAVYSFRHGPWERPALVTLALPFVATFMLYLVQLDSSAGVNGGRYYFEPFCLICIVAARGLTLFFERHMPGQTAISLVLVVFGILQVSQHIASFPALLSRSKPSREVWSLVHGPERVVFLHGADKDGIFIPKFCNWNDPDWRHADHVYLVDPGPENRAEWAARFGDTRWRVVGFAGDTLMVLTESGSVAVSDHRRGNAK